MKNHWLRFMIFVFLFGFSLPGAVNIALSRAQGEEDFIQLALAYVQDQAPQSKVSLLSSHTFTHSETGLTYSFVKAELDDWDSRLVTVRHSDGFIQPGNSLPEQDHLAYIQALPMPYRKMSQSLRAYIRQQYGELPGLLSPAFLPDAAPLPVILIVGKEADLGGLVERVRELDEDVSVYDSSQLSSAHPLTPEHLPIRLAAARLNLSQLGNVANGPEVETIWLNSISSANLDQSVPRINGDDVHNAGYQGGLARVGVLDSGFDETHPDRGVVSWCEDFTNSSDGCDDTHGHGSHVAGIIFSNHATRTGMAPDAELYIAKFTSGGNESGKLSTMISAIDELCDFHVHVINKSNSIRDDFGDGTSEGSRYLDWIVYRYGISIVNSAGNQGALGINTPADAYNILTVGATDAGFTAIANYSGRGPTADGRSKPDVVAPGTAITSFAHNWEGANPDFVDMEGTSMAAPHVTGLAALLVDVGERYSINRSPMLLKAIMINTADKLTGWTHTNVQPLDFNQGAGQINALAAYDAYLVTDQWAIDYVDCTTAACNQYYLIEVSNAPAWVHASLVWERHENNYTSPTPATLNDLDLALYSEDMVSRHDISVSLRDNVEHIRFRAISNGRYWLQVNPESLNTDGEEAYALVANYPMVSYGNHPLGAFNKISPAQDATNQPNQVTITWSQAVGNNGYEVCIDTSQNFTCNTSWIFNGAGTSALITNLIPGTTYSWQVRARNRFVTGEADMATWRTFTIDSTAPTAPNSANPGCSASNNTWQNTCADPNFTWSGANDSGSGIAGYYYYWGSNASGVSANYTTAAAFNPAAVASPSVTYLRVQTVDKAGNTSSWATVFTFKYDGTAPTNPTSANPGCSAASDVWQTSCSNPNFTWSGAGDGSGSGLAGYYYYWGGSSTGTSTNWTTGLGFDPPAVANPSVNYLRIQTKDNAGNTSAWKTLFVLKYDTTPLVVPSNLLGSPYSPSQISLSWSDNSLSESNFLLERSPDGSSGWTQIANLEAGTTSYIDSGLSCATTYFYRLRAFRSGDSNYSDYSAVASASTQGCGLLEPPSSLYAHNWDEFEIRLTWQDNSSNETAFQIERSINGVSNWWYVGEVAANITQYIDENLPCDTTFFYRVRAFRSNDSTWSEYSNLYSRKTVSCTFDAPNISTVVPAENGIDLTWVDNTSDEERFKIEMRPEGSTTWDFSIDVNKDETSVFYSGLSCDRLYSFRMRAYRGIDELWSDYSNTVSEATLGCDTPRAPTNLAVTSFSETRVDLAWDDNTHHESDYHIYMSPTGSTPWTEIAIVSYNSTSYVHEWLACDTDYYYRVRAHRHDDNTFSSYSNIIHALTYGCPWNDAIDYAYHITHFQFSRTQRSDHATTAEDDPSLWLGNSPGKGYHSLWYYFYSDGIDSGKLNMSGEGTGFYHTIAVFSGTPGNLQLLASDDYNSGSPAPYYAHLSVNLTPHTYYYVEVVGNTASDFGLMQLNASISEMPAPQLTSLRPAWTVAGLPGFHLTINGSNLVNGLTSAFIDGLQRTGVGNGASLTIWIDEDEITKVGTHRVFADNSAAGGGVSNELVFKVYPPTNFNLQSSYSNAAPTLDGFISSEEWTGAQSYDISAPDFAEPEQPYSYQDMFPVPGLISSWQQAAQAFSQFILYLKNDAGHLYLALDNPFDTIASGGYNQVYLFFDDNPLPSDGQWGATSCGNPEGEGYLRLSKINIDFYEKYEKGSCAAITPQGVNAGFSYSSGHSQVEIGLDLKSSPLRLLPGDSVMAYLYYVEGETGHMQGIWPNYGNETNPASFRSVTLDMVKLYLPLLLKNP